MTKKSQIPFHKEINDLYRFLDLEQRTDNPSFFIVKHQDIANALPKKSHPFRNDFYEASLILSGDSLEYTINQQKYKTPKHYLVFNCAGQVHSWSKLPNNLEGYVMFFKPEFVLQQGAKTVLTDFPFFNIQTANLFELNQEEAAIFSFYFEQIFVNANSRNEFNRELVNANLHAILWQSNKHYLKHIENKADRKKEDVITAQFRQLVNQHFLEKRTIDEFASLLNITPNHLSQTVKKSLGVNAKTLIDERIMLEADYLLQFTTADVKEISYQLNFTEPSHFNRFYKSHRQTTPAQFRNSI